MVFVIIPLDGWDLAGRGFPSERERKRNEKCVGGGAREWGEGAKEWGESSL